MHPSLRPLILCTALAASLPAFAQSAPQSYDDRWYITAGAGANFQDSARQTDNAGFATIGVGKNINPRWSLDLELNYQNPHNEFNNDLNYSQYGLSLDARRHFRKEDRRVNPYIVMGVGVQRAEEEFDAFPSPISPGQSTRTFATAKLGFGAQADFRRVSLRGEIAARHSFDRDSITAPNRSGFTDTLASLTLIVPLGSRTMAAVQPAVYQPVQATVATTCANLDDDNDGVNNCDDQCSDSRAGQAIGPNGCAVPLTIDLRGVNFDFDRDTLRSDATENLDEAIAILQKYPQMRVQVAGHTDSKGSEAYNQDLSERRAAAVFDYLVDHGVEQSRLIGPVGFGETHPIAPNTHEDGSDNPEGRAMNRRTELNVDNGDLENGPVVDQDDMDDDMDDETEQN